MDGNDDLDRKISEAIDRKFDQRFGPGKRRKRNEHVFFGLCILGFGLFLLGQNLGIEWIENIKFWPIAIMLFGLYLIFGDRW